MNKSRVLQFALGCIFRTCRNFWASTDSSLVKNPKISTRHKTSTAIASIVYFSSLRDSAKQNRGNPPCENSRFCDSQNLVKNNSVRSTQTRPLRGAKNRKEGCSSATADFLLEADKRGSPPKSEKAAAFWRVGGAGRGVQPFLRKESSEISGNGGKIAESALDSTTRRIQKVRRICTKFCAILALQIPLFATSLDEIFTPNKNHSINIVSENDAYFEPFIKSDRYYTGGHFISYTSPEFENSWINKIAAFSHLQDRHFTRFLISINQELYTPNKARNYDFIAPKDDILFGAGLYANIAFISRTRDFMEQFSLDLGVVGALAFGKETQNLIHKATNNPIYRGWDAPNGTLKNEALLNLHYGLIYRWVFIEDFFDVLPSFQISLGNALTAINAGAKFRVGYGIKNDFGAQKLRSRFAQNVVGDGLKVYAFFGASGSIVGRDIFIEGNSFGGAKSGVTINRFLYEIEVGAMVGWKYVSLGYVWSDESPRFKEQGTHHKYGSVRLEIMF